MTVKQIYAACQSILNLPFTDAELQNYIKQALDTAGDGTGKIKTDDFASYLAAEAEKTWEKNQNANQSTENKSNELSKVVYIQCISSHTYNDKYIFKKASEEFK